MHVDTAPITTVETCTCMMVGWPNATTTAGPWHALDCAMRREAHEVIDTDR